MSKYRYTESVPPSGLPAKIIYLLFIIFLIQPVLKINDSYASDFSSKNYKLTFQNNLLSISAENADLKNILTDIAKTKGISMRFPDSMDTKITIKISESTVQEALERLLKDFNYSIVYSGKKKRDRISDVFIFRLSEETPQMKAKDNRIANSIKSYERRIESLKNSMSKVGENSTRGRSYLNRIKNYERRIETLKRQLD